MAKTTKQEYDSLARRLFDRAMDTSLPLPLRQYYAGLALWCDKRGSKFHA